MKKTNKLISILVVVAMILSIVPMNLSVSAAPDTDYTGYYKITNAGNLAWFACLVVGDTSQSGITEAEPDAKAVLTADIDITVLAERLGKSWVGIGTAEIPFIGIFDGNGYTIKGLTTDTSLTKSSVATVDVDAEKQGLFGVIGEGGVVRDVIVEGTANLSDTIKYGGICSENNGTIENVLSLITVTGGDNSDVFCHTNNGTITNSFANQTSVNEGVTLVTAAELADGSVTYALGDSFGQTIGTDLQPVHYDGTNRVYKVGDTYTNTEPVYVASVTDKDGNAVGSYTTLADAVTAASESEGSTLTLLDDITLTERQTILSGNFIIDLNGKTLSGEDLDILNSVVLTITDNGENGTIEINSDTYSCIYNYGKLTVEQVTIKGSCGIDNRGICTLDGIIIEVSDRQAFTNDGTAHIYNSVLKSEKDDAITNNPNAILYVYDSKLTGDAGITNHSTVYVYDCEIKGISYAALNLLSGIVEITGSSLSGTDSLYGNYSGTPYGEWTVDYDDGVTLTFKGGEFPNGFVVDDIAAYTLLAEGYHFRDADGKIVEVAEDATKIDGYVKVTKGADLEKEAVITLDQTEFTYTGGEIKPTVTVTVGGKTLIEGKDYTISFSNNINAGTATVTIKAIGQTSGDIAGESDINIGNSSNEGAINAGNYTGEIAKEFTIIPATVDIIWSETTEFEFDGNPHSVTATYVDLNGEIVNALVENGTNTETGTYTATASVADANYFANEETTSIDYMIRGSVKLTGTVESNGTETDEVTLVLAKDGDTENSYETTITGTSSDFAFENLEKGTYTLTVSKADHVTRVYEIVIAEEQALLGETVTQDAKIHLVGDINGDGKLNTMDVARANAHAKGVTALEGYALQCADINSDGKVNTMDVARMNAHAKGITTLW